MHPNTSMKLKSTLLVACCCAATALNSAADSLTIPIASAYSLIDNPFLTGANTCNDVWPPSASVPSTPHGTTLLFFDPANQSYCEAVIYYAGAGEIGRAHV